MSASQSLHGRYIVTALLWWHLSSLIVSESTDLFGVLTVILLWWDRCPSLVYYWLHYRWVRRLLQTLYLIFFKQGLHVCFDHLLLYCSFSSRRQLQTRMSMRRWTCRRRGRKELWTSNKIKTVRVKCISRCMMDENLRWTWVQLTGISSAASLEPFLSFQPSIGIFSR